MTTPSPDTRARRLWLSLALLLCCAPAAAGATQTFVSAKGDDANMCEQAKPCRTIAGAIPRTNIGGEIAVLDSGEYGPFHVPFSMKVTAEGVYAGVSVDAADAITVNVNSGSVVALRGLTLSGTNSSRGIVYTGPSAVREGDDSEPGASLHVEDCTISGFSIAGISFEGNGWLFVKDTTVRNTSGAGLAVSAPSNQKARASVVNTRLEKNDRGLSAYGQGTVEVTARDTVAAGNKGAGFFASQSVWALVRLQLKDCVSANQAVGVWVADGARASLDGCTLTNNKDTGAFATNNGQLRVSNTTVTNNGVGISNSPIIAGPHGQVYTFGNNHVHGNKTDTAGTPAQFVQKY